MLQSHDITISFINHAYLIYHSTYVQFVFGSNQEKIDRKKYLSFILHNGKIYKVLCKFTNFLYSFYSMNINQNISTRKDCYNLAN